MDEKKPRLYKHEGCTGCSRKCEFNGEVCAPHGKEMKVQGAKFPCNSTK